MRSRFAKTLVSEVTVKKRAFLGAKRRDDVEKLSPKKLITLEKNKIYKDIRVITTHLPSKWAVIRVADEKQPATKKVRGEVKKTMPGLKTKKGF